MRGRTVKRGERETERERERDRARARERVGERDRERCLSRTPIRRRFANNVANSRIIIRVDRGAQVFRASHVNQTRMVSFVRMQTAFPLVFSSIARGASEPTLLENRKKNPHALASPLYYGELDAWTLSMEQI